MGREIRRVPANWEHPRWTEEDATNREWIGDYRACHDEPFKVAAAEWKRRFYEWERGVGDRMQKDGTMRAMEFWEWDGMPPEPEQYRPEFTDQTWFQVYETVSEGTPVTPPFATPEELARYLSTHGDFWYQQRMAEPERVRFAGPLPSYEEALAFVTSGYALSFVVTANPGEPTRITGPYETPPEISE